MERVYVKVQQECTMYVLLVNTYFMIRIRWIGFHVSTMRILKTQRLMKQMRQILQCHDRETTSELLILNY